MTVRRASHRRHDGITAGAVLMHFLKVAASSRQARLSQLE